jgi:mannose/fructose/N-acetylgalactosamine-specific phosphotransferase system component IIB
MISVQCKICRTELSSTSKDQCCGCSNQMVLKDDKVTAVNLGDVLITKNNKSINNHISLSKSDLEYQENRRRRKVRKLDFEVR